MLCLAFKLSFFFLLCSLFLPASGAALTAKTPATPVVRWDEGSPGCTFSRSADGRYQYGMWSDNAGVILAVDSQELEKVRRRHELFFSVALTVRYRGASALDVNPGTITLEFVKHFKVVQTSLDPDGFSQKVQNDADEFDHQIAREVQKHPEEKETKQATMRSFQKDAAELLEFLSKNTLKTAHLDSGNREAVGWVLFSTESKWISGWKKQEEFVLRVPLDGKVFEFPFKLPPKQGELLLRQRE
jgi:hypothetical protein